MRPDKLTIHDHQNPVWHDNNGIEKRINKLKRLGFREIGIFTAEEIPNLQIAYYLSSDKTVIATIYESYNDGIWIDFVTYYKDGSAFNYTTSPRELILENPKWYQVSFRRKSVKGLYGKFLKQMPPKEPVELCRDEIIKRIEREWEDHAAN